MNAYQLDFIKKHFGIHPAVNTPDKCNDVMGIGTIAVVEKAELKEIFGDKAGNYFEICNLEKDNKISLTLLDESLTEVEQTLKK